MRGLNIRKQIKKDTIPVKKRKITTKIDTVYGKSTPLPRRIGQKVRKVTPKSKHHQYRIDTTIAGNTKRKRVYNKLLTRNGLDTLNTVGGDGWSGDFFKGDKATRLAAYSDITGEDKYVSAENSGKEDVEYDTSPSKADRKAIKRGYDVWLLPKGAKASKKEKIKPIVRRKKVKSISTSSKGIASTNFKAPSVKPEKLFVEDGYNVTTYSKNAMGGENSLNEMIYSKDKFEDKLKRNKALNKRTMYKTNYKRKKAIPKHFWGALIGAGVSAVSSVIQGNKQAAAEEKRRLEERRRAQSLTDGEDLIEANKYNNEGTKMVGGYYQAKGGTLRTNTASTYKTKGGKLKQVSSDMVKAVGNRHEESKIDNTSGIKLYKKGKAIAEIEGGEAVKANKMVYSDRLKVNNTDTYADKALELAREKNNTKNLKKKALLNTAENSLFLHQETTKKQKNKGNKAKFGDFLKGENGKKIGNFITPLIDNIGNAILTSNTPKLAKPTLERVKNRKTTVNVNPQLAAVTNAVAGATTSIKNNTANSNTARANIAATKLKGAKQKANILSAKENKETELANANQDKIQATQARNIAKLNAHGHRKVARQDDIQRRVSANISNLTGDLVDNINRNNKEKNEDRRLDIIERMYNTGTTNRDMLKDSHAVARIKADPSKKWNRYIGSKEQDAFLETAGYHPNNEGVDVNPLKRKLSPLNTKSIEELTEEEKLLLKRNKYARPLNFN